MAITTVDQLVAGFTGVRSKVPIAKAAILNAVTGGNMSYWRSVGNPTAGGVPAAAATCNSSTLGAILFSNPTAGISSYLGRWMYGTTVAQATEVHDRLAHMGGLNGTLTTAQTVGLDINALAATDNIAQRKGRSDFGSLQWWLENYTATGATATTAIVSYTNHLGTAGITVSVAIPANFRAQALIQIIPANGDFIRSVESVTLLATTGTAGNFGVTVTNQRTEAIALTANVGAIFDWAALGLPQIFDSSCLFFISNNSTTTAGTLFGATTIIQG